MPPSKFTPLPPELAFEWHPTRNGDLTPDQVSRGSTKKVWWQCQQGHYWEGSPDSRSRSGVSKPCPYCIDKRIWSGYNDLATRLPELILEWDYERNTVDPTRLAPRTHDKVWWQCQQCSHSWQASPHNRARTGCPECGDQSTSRSRRTPSKGQSLQDLRPDVAAFWHPVKNGDLTPSDITAKSNQKVWWLCSIGHPHQAAVVNQGKKPNACGVCAGRQVIAGVNDLASKYPHLVTEWAEDLNELTPEEVTPYSDKRIWWRCPLSHTYESTCRHKTAGDGCPYCSGRRVLQGFNDIATTHPELAAQWHPVLNTLAPSELTYGSTKKAYWLCQVCSHVWSVSPNARVQRNNTSISVCPQCSNRDKGKALQIAQPGRSLLELYPEVATYWHPTKNGEETPATVAASVGGRKHWWQCSLGHVTERTIASVVYSYNKNTSNNETCSVCSGNTLLSGHNDLATKYSLVAEEWDYDLNQETPNMVSSRSSRLFWWKCKESHPSYQMSCDERSVKVKTGCPYCNNLKVLTDYNDLASQFPDVSKEYSTANTIASDKIYKHSSERVLWICSTNKSHTWRATVVNRTTHMSGCPHCVRGITSKIEKAIRDELSCHDVFSQISKDHLTRVLINEKRAQIDVLATLKDDRHVVIEYDGEYYHNGSIRPGKPQQDFDATRYLLDNGYIVVRIREGNLVHLNINHHNLLQINYAYSRKPKDVSQLVETIVEWIETK